ncbi:MAG TPA: glycosyltransferase family 4 protein [Nocardioidaceae bacterium]|nr:glycosyltransferase family 4 protein [Nocardioidaceae bacterium]
MFNHSSAAVAQRGRRAARRIRRAASPARRRSRRIYLLLASIDDHGGVQRSVTTLANGLADRHRVEVISVSRSRARPPLELDSRVRVSYLVDRRGADGAVRGTVLRPLSRWLDRRRPRLVNPAADNRSYSLLSELRIIRKLVTLRPGILVTNRPSLHVAGARYAPRRVPVVAFEHGALVSRGRIKRARMRRYGDRLAAVVTLNETDREANAELLDGIVARVSMIPNAVSHIPAAAAELTRQPVIVSAGTLLRRKGFDRLLRAWAAVCDQHPDWQLHIYGRGRERRRLEQLVTRLGVQEQARLRGYSRDLGDVIARSSILAVTSRYEAFGMTIVEAMAQGVPVVSFDCPNGPRNIIRHGHDGLLVPNGDVRAFSAELTRLIEDEALRRTMGQAARQNVRRFDIERVIDQWDALFDEVAPR